METNGFSTESLFNMILDEIDDMIIINDPDRTVVWMNRAAQRRLDVAFEDVVGTKCYELFGATCCCDSCVANHIVGGPRRCGCRFKCRSASGEFECEPIPYYKNGKLLIVVQHLRPVQQK